MYGKISDILAEKAYEQIKFPIIFKYRSLNIRFHLKVMLLPHGVVIGGYIRSAVWLSTFSKSLKISGGLPQDMISSQFLFSHLFILLLSSFCLNDTSSLRFQKRPNITEHLLYSI
jgi:hypothetical protein